MQLLLGCWQIHKSTFHHPDNLSRSVGPLDVVQQTKELPEQSVASVVQRIHSMGAH
jgi:hypothetical protein